MPDGTGSAGGAGKTYDLEIRESEEREETPKVTVTCKTEDPTVIITCKAEDPREEIAQKEKTFALVLTGTGETELPEDARLKVGKREYRTSGKDSFILPLGDMQNENSNWEFTLLSDLFPEEEKEYHLQRSFAGQIHSQKAGFKGENSNRTPDGCFQESPKRYNRSEDHRCQDIRQ